MQQGSASQDSITFSVRAIGVYGLLTAVLLLTLISLTNTLSRYPRYLPDETPLIPPQWTVVTNHELTFTFDMPSSWKWYEKQESGASAAFDLALNENPGVETAVSLFRRIDPQTEIKIIAVAESDLSQPPFLFVAQSKRMSQLTPTKLAAALSSEVAGSQQIQIVTLPGRPEAVKFILELQMDSDIRRCLYQYTYNEDAGFVIGGCLPPKQLGAAANELLAMQNSFQLLFR